MLGGCGVFSFFADIPMRENSSNAEMAVLVAAAVDDEIKVIGVLSTVVIVDEQ